MPLTAKLESKVPALFTPSAVMVTSVFGLLLMLPVLAAMLFVSVVQFGLLTFLLPLATIGLATFFLPLGFGNPYICSLVRRFSPGCGSREDTFVVQLTRIPRRRSGFWAVMEDADDIGCLALTEAGLVFTGDALQLTVPYESIRELKQRNAGWRSLFAYGVQSCFSVAGLTDEGTFCFAERSSWFLPSSRKIASRMYRRLSERTRLSTTSGPVGA